MDRTWDFFQTCSFSFFIKLLNQDRVTPIPHLNLLNFPKIQHFIFFQNQICQCLNIRIWMEKLQQQFYSRSLFFFPKYGRVEFKHFVRSKMWELNLNVLISFFLFLFFFQNRNVVNTLNFRKRENSKNDFIFH